jgi:hypothetical protein
LLLESLSNKIPLAWFDASGDLATSIERQVFSSYFSDNVVVLSRPVVLYGSQTWKNLLMHYLSGALAGMETEIWCIYHHRKGCDSGFGQGIFSFEGVD